MTEIKHKYEKNLKYNLPDRKGFFGEFGGAYVPEKLQLVLKQLEVDFEKAWADDNFLNEVYERLKEISGRPTPLYFAENLTKHYGNKAKIYIKREDLNHTGSHKLNNVMGQALLAKKLGNKKVIAETGAGQHGVAVATAAAFLDMECKVFMGSHDIARQKLNVERMKMLGAEVIAVEDGLKTLKDAVDAAINYWLENCDDTFYILGSTVGPHPYPKIVRSFQSIIGVEIKEQILEKEGRLPDYVLACVGGGSNASGTFYPFYDDTDKVKLIGLEAGGEGVETGKHSAALAKGKKVILQGGVQYALVDENGNVGKSYSISAGIDYPGCGPELCYMKDAGKAEFYPVTDNEAIKAFGLLSKIEGIVPAIESAHAVAYLEHLMPQTKEGEIVIVTLSGRGDKDGERLVQYFE
ncbi:MAG: tryptophan synthase subunit beta [Cyanobacteria bacterium SIG30]|nr:tryptophan synthase subunit beta [Cyanobacteria bacterium SIG30]